MKRGYEPIIFGALFVTVVLGVFYYLTVTGGIKIKPERVYNNKVEYVASSKYTVLVYMCGENAESEDSFASDSIKEMMDATTQGHVNVVVQTGGSNRWNLPLVSQIKSQRWSITKGDMKELWATDKPLNMGAPETLTDFISWGVANKPADKYILVLWGKGAAWQGVCNDSIYNDVLTINEVKTALEGFNSKTKQKLEMIAFDASYMACAEAVGAVMNYAKFMVASQDMMPNSGLNYKDTLEYIAENTDLNGDSIGKQMKNVFKRKLMDQNISEHALLSVINLEKAKAVEDAVNKLGEKILNSGDLKNKFYTYNIAKARANSGEFGRRSLDSGYSYNMVDIYELAAALEHNFNVESLEIKNAITKAVISEQSRDENTIGYGISMFLPSGVGDVEGQDVAKYSNTFKNNYSNFLNKYYAGISAMGQNNIKFVRPLPTKNENNKLEVELDRESWSTFNSGYAVLFQRVNNDSYRKLALNSRIAFDITRGKVEYDFNNKWTKIGSTIVPTYNLSSNYYYTISAICVKHDGKFADLVMVRRRDSSYNKPLYIIVWPDSNTKMSSRKQYEIKSEYNIKTVYEIINLKQDNNTILEESAPLELNDFKIVNESVMEGEYYIGYMINDSLNHNYYSGLVKNYYAK